MLNCHSTQWDLKLCHEDLDQIPEEDLDEMDLKCSCLLKYESKKVLIRELVKRINHQRSDTSGYEQETVECSNCHKVGDNLLERAEIIRVQENRSKNHDSSRRTVNVEKLLQLCLAIDGTDLIGVTCAQEEASTHLHLWLSSDSELQNNKNLL
ncbi:hypothetical protein Tco_0698152 [Tanacetum coccineum]